MLNVFWKSSLVVTQALAGLNAEETVVPTINNSSIYEDDEVSFCEKSDEFDLDDSETISEHVKNLDWVQNDVSVLKKLMNEFKDSRTQIKQLLISSSEKYSEYDIKIKQIELELIKQKEKVKPILKKLQIQTPTEELEKINDTQTLIKTIIADINDLYKKLIEDWEEVKAKSKELTRYDEEVLRPSFLAWKSNWDIEIHEKLIAKYWENKKHHRKLQEEYIERNKEHHVKWSHYIKQGQLYLDISFLGIVDKEKELSTAQKLQSGTKNIMLKTEQMLKQNNEDLQESRKICSTIGKSLINIIEETA